MAGEFAALPEGYDAERHATVRAELERLREIEKRITQLETRLERQPAVRSTKAKAEETASEPDDVEGDAVVKD